MAALKNAWIHEEMSDCELGDERLEKRAVEIMDDFTRDPGAPINQASGNSSRAMAAYRFFRNQNCSPEGILMSHFEHTAQRASTHQLVLVLHDTMTVNYGTHPATEGLGHIGSSNYHPDSRGLFVHSSYCLSTDGVPLGLLAQKTWSRQDVVKGRSPNQGKIDSRRKPIEAKESVRWLEAAKASRALVPSSTQLVHIADREGDFFEFFSLATKLGDAFIIRAKSDRQLLDECDETGALLSESFEGKKPLSRLIVEVKGNSSRRPRLAKLNLYARTLTLKAPQRAVSQQSDYVIPPDLEVYAVWAIEHHAPAGVKPISWLLLTSLEVSTAAGCEAAVGYYARRWRIEELHKTLKSGCKIEDCRLETLEGLKRFIAAKSIIAHRIVELTYRQRQNPNGSCLEILTDLEWRCLYIRTGSRVLPAKPPTLRDVTRHIAQLGGFLGRKGDGEPGIVTLWRGWTRFEEGLAMATALQQAGAADICV